MVRPFLNTGSISEKGVGVQTVQSMPNLEERSGAVWFGDITFMMNLIGGWEAQQSVNVASVSYCAMLVACLKPKSTRHNEPAPGMDKSLIISDYSHCRFSWLALFRSKALFETPHTYCGLGSLLSPARRISEPCQEIADNRATQQSLPILCLSVFVNTTITHMQSN